MALDSEEHLVSTLRTTHELSTINTLPKRAVGLQANASEPDMNKQLRETKQEEKGISNSTPKANDTRVMLMQCLLLTSVGANQGYSEYARRNK
jgi:hypothetical protein